MMNKVSVVIPCYNQAQYLADSVQSVLNQTYSNWECIIVNDGSTDNTAQVALSWCAKDERIKYVSKDNGGLSSARNCGIQNSSGNYILTLDADDMYEATFMSKAVAILDNNPGIGVVSCWGYRFSNCKDYTVFKPNGKTLEDFLYRNAAIGTSLFRKKCWEEVDGYDESMKYGYEDWEFYIRVGKYGYRTEIIQEPLFFYRQRKGSMRNVAVNDHDSQIKFYIFMKHKDLYLENFEGLIQNLLSIAANNKKSELKRINSIDFKLGSFILRPLRILKNIFRK